MIGEIAIRPCPASNARALRRAPARNTITLTLSTAGYRVICVSSKGYLNSLIVCSSKPMNHPGAVLNHISETVIEPRLYPSLAPLFVTYAVELSCPAATLYAV
jgi:hypothetical protein